MRVVEGGCAGSALVEFNQFCFTSRLDASGGSVCILHLGGEGIDPVEAVLILVFAGVNVLVAGEGCGSWLVLAWSCSIVVELMFIRL